MARPAAILLGLVIFSPGLLQAEVIDRVVAVVNSDIITLSELEEQGKDALRRAEGEEDQEAAAEEIKRQLLSQLVERKLTQQEAEKAGIEVSDSELDGAFTQILKRNSTDSASFEQGLASIGKTVEEYRNLIKEELRKRKLINQQVRSKIVITDSKIREYYDRHYSAANVPEGYHVLQLGFSWDEEGGEASREEARKRAEHVIAELQGGRSFRELADDFSDLPSARDGGDLGFLKKDEMASYMRDVLVGMKPGEISGIVETPAGYQIFKLLSSREGDLVAQSPYEAVREEIADLVYREEVGKQYDKWVQDLRSQSYVKILL